MTWEAKIKLVSEKEKEEKEEGEKVHWENVRDMFKIICPTEKKTVVIFQKLMDGTKDSWSKHLGISFWKQKV